jgi:hypothetical protein
MSYQTYTNSATPSTPASGKSTAFVGTDGRPQVLNSTGVLNLLVGQAANLVRNSGFWFAQRQTPGTLTTYSNTSGRSICADGWGITNENASAQFRRVDTLTPETGLADRFYGEFTKITSTGKLVVTQVIENADIALVRGRTVRVSCKMKQVVGSAPIIRLGLLQLTAAGTVDSIPATFVSAFGANGTDPTLGTNVSRITPKSGVTAETGTVNGNAVDCTLSSSWQKFSAVFDVPTDAKNLIICLWGNAQFAATNGFAVADVMLTDGYEIRDFEPLPYAVEMRRVQRFYQKTFSIDTAPAQNLGTATGQITGILGKAGAIALAAILSWRYPVRMRAAATTLTLYSPGSASAQVRQISGTAADLTASATANSTESGVDVTATGAATGAVGDQVGVHISADAEL